MANSMGTGSVDKYAASVFDNTATISKNVECKGDFILIDPFTNSEQKVTDEDFSKINNIINGRAGPSKMLVLDANKSIDGINMQTNYDVFTLSKIDSCDCDNFLFKRSRGTATSLKKAIHHDKIGSINFLPLLPDTTTYYNTSSIFSRVVGGNFTVSNNNYLGSELLFQTTGVGIDSYNDDRVKIDTYGNLSVLNRGEMRMYSHGKNNYSSFRSASSSAKPGYTMELPPDKGNLGDSLTVQGVGSGGQISITSDSEGIITSTSIVSAGSGYDLSYPPEIDTMNGLNGGVITENGTASNTTTNTSQIYLSSNASASDDYYEGWIIETVNPNYKRIIIDYVGSSKLATLSSSMTTLPTINTTYKLTWAPKTGTMQSALTLSSSEVDENDYYVGWTITVDVSGTIATGEITDYTGSSKTITVSLSPTVTTDSSTVYSLIRNDVIPATLKISSINSSGQITAVSLLDGGQGYIPSTTTTVNLSSQNRLQWTPVTTGLDLSTWGMKVLEGTVQQTGNGTWIFLEDHDTELNDYNLEWVIITTNPSWHASAFQYSSSDNALNPVGSLPTTTTSTTYKLIKYTTGVYAGGSGTNSSTTQVNLKSKISHNFNSSVTISSIDNYYQGWIILTYSTGMSTNDPYIGVITSYDGTTGIAQASLKNSNGDFYNSASSSYFALSNASILGTNLTVGDGLSGGGLMTSNISVDFDLSTHDNTTDTSNYTTNNTTDKILLYQTSSSNSKLPTMSNFLSTISGTGITSNSSGLEIERNQDINELTSNYLKIRGSSGNEESIYLNIGKNDTNNLNILPSYTNNKLSSVVIKSDTSNSSDNAKIQFDIGDNDNILDIHNSGISIKSGFVTAVTIVDDGNETYTSVPTITFEQSPMGSSYTATATCSLTNNSISSVTITYAGEGYITAPTISLSGGSTGSLTCTIADRTITGAVGSTSTKFPGKFSSITSDGDVTVGGTITGALTLESSDILTFPGTNNLTFTNSSDKTIKFGYGVSNSINDTSATVLIGYETGNSLPSTSGNNTMVGYQSGKNTTSGFNTFIGDRTGYYTTTGHSNNFMGYLTGLQNTTGNYNTFLGWRCGYANTTGIKNIFIGAGSSFRSTTGDYHVVMGTDAGFYMTTSTANTFIGFESGYYNTGSYNTFLGSDSGRGSSGSSGGDNVCIGRRSGYSLTSGSNITYVGLHSGYSNTSGYDNTFIGRSSGFSNTTGYSNVFIGTNSGYKNTTGFSNIIIGSYSGYSNTSGDYNTFIGQYSGYSSTTSNSILCIGYRAGYYNTATENMFIGIQSGEDNTTETGNTYIGYYSGKEATSSNNTFIGYETGKVTTGDNNTFIGFESGLSNTSGYQNTFLGMQCGKANTTGFANSFLGYTAGLSNTTGQYNTFLGWRSGRYNTTGERNIFIGAGTGNSNVSGVRNIYIGVDSGYYNGGRDNVYLGNSAGLWDAGTENTFIGSYSGKQFSPAINDTFRNTFVGHKTGYSNEGEDNTFIGNKAGYSNTLGDYNTYVGSGAGESSTTAIRNTFVGFESGKNATGNYNTCLGYRSGTAMVSGDQNTFIGHGCVEKFTSGTHNVYMGSAAGYETTSSIYNTCVGVGAGRLNNTGSMNAYFGISAGYYLMGDKNVALGRNAGPSSYNYDDYGLYIDSEQNGTGSFIYGDMTPGSRAMTVNATLTVTGNITGNINGSIGATTKNTGAFTSISVDSARLQVNTLYGPAYGSLALGYLTNNNTGSSYCTSIGHYSQSSSTTGDYNTSVGYETGRYITSGYNNTLIGYRAGKDISSGYSNTYIGENCGTETTYGYENTALGCGALKNNTTGDYNTIIGYSAATNSTTANRNTFVGRYTGRYTTSGSYNTLLGYSAGYYANGTGSTFIGYLAGFYNSTGGNYNSSLGYGSLYYSRTGDYNIAIGYYAGRGNSSSLYGKTSYNVFIGRYSGYSITTGNFNSCSGDLSGYRLTSGYGNSLHGRSSGIYLTSGIYNSFLGYQSGYYIQSGSRNICIGYNAGPTSFSTVSDKIYIDNDRNGSASLIYGDTSDSGRYVTINGSLNITGSLNSDITGDLQGSVTISSSKTLNIYSTDRITISSSSTSFYLGYQSANGGARTRSDDLYNTAIGTLSGFRLSSGDSNTFYGYASGFNNTSGPANTCIGQRSGFSISSGSSNVCLGAHTIYYGPSASYNTAVGSFAGKFTTGNYNTFLGYYAGYYNRGSSNICIGNQAGATSTTSSNYYLYIDSSRKGSDSLIYGYTYGTTSNYIRINGTFYVKSGKVAYASSWSNYSDITLKENISPITDDIIGRIELLNPVNFNWKSNGEEDVGFIAQEMKDIFPLLVNENNNDNILSVDYARLTTYLVKGMKEQNKKIDELEKELEQQKQKNISLEKYFKDEIEKLRKEFLHH